MARKAEPRGTRQAQKQTRLETGRVRESEGSSGLSGTHRRQTPCSFRLRPRPPPSGPALGSRTGGRAVDRWVPLKLRLKEQQEGV